MNTSNQTISVNPSHIQNSLVTLKQRMKSQTKAFRTRYPQLTVNTIPTNGCTFSREMKAFKLQTRVSVNEPEKFVQAKEASSEEDNNSSSREVNRPPTLRHSLLFELQSLLRVDFESQLTIKTIFETIQELLEFLCRLETYAREQGENLGVLFQRFRAQIDSAKFGQLRRTPHGNRSRPAFPVPSGVSLAEKEFCSQTKQLIEFVRIKVEDAVDLQLAKQALQDASKTLRRVCLRWNFPMETTTLADLSTAI